jgi:hypothetical protein
VVRRLVIVLALAGAAAFFFFAFSSDRNEGAPVTDQAIERLIPEPRAETLRQTDVGVDLRVGYAAKLSIDGVAIPEDEVGGIREQGEYIFRPGDGKQFDSFEAGRHEARATITNLEQPTQDPIQIAWAFDVT